MVTSFLCLVDHITMSGLSVVWTISGKTSFFPKSTFISHWSDSSKIDVFIGGCFVVVSPALTKLIFVDAVFFAVLFFLLSRSSTSASSLRTASCLHL
ncbi:hypothetical protein DPMN_029713 [Dreissena polymorpha]|uniref:Uncharacterized protein n=1 Tax=Dreissena polymorpha TaxID=45954 RepID=A0A9D4LZ22_DREPO|nr:hypothetical protein DPMN_023341 [Dreissena polymorpha]KAH3866616.1 hypothetical protein DPMN_029713 [Dreissena polymorpha]